MTTYNDTELDDTDVVQDLLEGHSPRDLKDWMETAFFKASLLYLLEQMTLLRKDIINGEPVGGYKNTDEMRGALKAFEFAATVIPVALTEDIVTAAKRKQERRENNN